MTIVAMIGGVTSARADTTTSCEFDSWGDYHCTTSTDPPTAPGTIEGAPLIFTVLAAIIAGVYAYTPDETVDPTLDDEGGLAIMVGVEVLNPVYLHFMSPSPEEDAQTEWKRKLTVILQAWGSGVSDAGSGTVGAPGGRLTLGKGRVGLEVEGESAIDRTRYSVVRGHLLLRAPPRRHTMFALAVGASRITYGDQVRQGLDISVPHAYILSKDDETGAADVLLASRPGFFYSSENGLDVRLDLALVVPVAKRVAIEIGAGAFSFDTQLGLRGSGGLAIGL